MLLLPSLLLLLLSHEYICFSSSHGECSRFRLVSLQAVATQFVRHHAPPHPRGPRHHYYTRPPDLSEDIAVCRPLISVQSSASFRSVQNCALEVCSKASINKTKLSKSPGRRIKTSKDKDNGSSTCNTGTKPFVLVDGNFTPPGLGEVESKCVIGGDALEYCIAAASIIAKVTRDRLMVRERGGRREEAEIERAKRHPYVA